MANVRDIYDIIDKFAPFNMTYKNDNSGLIVGDFNDKVNKILFCLDITVDIVNEAISKSVDLIISHHPVIFHPLYNLTSNSPAILMARAGINAICCHTNLDMAENGLNDFLIEKLDLIPTDKILDVQHSRDYFQLSVFVPKKNVESVFDAMVSAGAGRYDKYSGCSFRTNGKGTFKPEIDAKPFIGQIDNFEIVDEVKLEMLVCDSDKNRVIEAMLNSHPYETPAYSLCKNNAVNKVYGLGRVCMMKEPLTCEDFAKHIKSKLNNYVVRFNNTYKTIKTVAVCSGSGGKYYKKAMELGADALLTGDVEHDKFIDAHNIGFSIFDAGHYETENIFSDRLIEVISKELTEIEFLKSTDNASVMSYLV